ncbi:hypothetical protein ACFP2T_43320 [Plantactinospora solaniradicis]|uniref:Uncharacterized protein n=1 Tax=Plantactinospora solaniradicis TaxID=1723736 RepID=A0ABW1KQ49_9ACTN
MASKTKTDRQDIDGMSKDSLREYAKGIGVKFPPRLGEDKMREQIREHWRVRDAQKDVTPGSVGAAATIKTSATDVKVTKPVSAPPAATFSDAQEPAEPATSTKAPRQRRATKAAVPPVVPVAAAASSTARPTKTVEVPSVKGGRSCMGRWDDGTGVATHRMQKNDGPPILCVGCVTESTAVNGHITWVPVGG